MSFFKSILQFLGLLQKNPTVQAAETVAIKAAEPAVENAVNNVLKKAPGEVQAIGQVLEDSAINNLNKNLPGQ